MDRKWLSAALLGHTYCMRPGAPSSNMRKGQSRAVIGFGKSDLPTPLERRDSLGHSTTHQGVDPKVVNYGAVITVADYEEGITLAPTTGVFPSRHIYYTAHRYMYCACLNRNIPHPQSQTQGYDRKILCHAATTPLNTSTRPSTATYTNEQN